MSVSEAAAVLSDTDIRREMGVGNIVVSPFREGQLSNCSYDVTLGEFFYRNTVRMEVFNPWCEAHVRKFWGEPRHASAARSAEEAADLGLRDPQQRFIRISPGETVLAHTAEFIGGRHHITTMMKARSSLGRSNIGVCKCAGWGDIGYVNRWTLEITNFSVSADILLPVGSRIAQIVFLYAGIPSREYHGKYQDPKHQTLSAPADIVAALERAWTPESMLPKLWLDLPSV